jgi:Domain of unknown function (DUF4136)
MHQEMRVRMARVGIVFLFALLACSATPAQDVSTNAMPGTDFSKYHTYKWVTIQGASHPNQIVDTQIKNSIDSQLSAKGLKKTDDENADLYIGYQASIDQEKAVERVWYGRRMALRGRDGNRDEFHDQRGHSRCGYV